MLGYLVPAVVLGTLHALSPVGSPQQPTHDILIEDGPRPPATLESLARESALVAVVRVGETTAHLLPSGIVVTDYQCSVRERLSGRGPEEFVVRIPGGTAGGRRTVNAKVPPLETGADYLLFQTLPPQA